MKRFWKMAEIVEEDGGWTIRIDGKLLRTPLREKLLVPTQVLAQSIADEWNRVEERIDPGSIPLTGLANAAIDRIRPDPQSFAAALAQYAETDLTYYRADRPRELVERQAQSWDVLLAWARRRFDVDFRTTSGIIHIAQPEATLVRLAHAVLALDEFRLAGLSSLVTIGGSLVAALAVLEGEITPEHGWDAVALDERWQVQQWGSDPEAEQRLENNCRDFLAAAQFLELLAN